MKAVRDTEKETKEVGYTRREMERMATDRKRWRSLVDSLCSQWANRHKCLHASSLGKRCKTWDRSIKIYDVMSLIVSPSRWYTNEAVLWRQCTQRCVDLLMVKHRAGHWKDSLKMSDDLVMHLVPHYLSISKLLLKVTQFIWWTQKMPRQFPTLTKRAVSASLPS